MTTLVWRQPGLATLIGMSMSDNRPANANEIKRASDAAAVNIARPHNTRPANSNIPDLPENYEEAFTSERNISETRNAQLKRLLSNTWLRVVVLGAIAVLILLFVLLFRSLSAEKPLVFDGSAASSSVEIDKSKTGKDNLNSQQAEYLMDQRRQDARARADAGQSSAAIIELPRASAEQANLAESSQTAFGEMNVKNRYDEEARRQNMLNNGAVGRDTKLDLTNTGRYEQAGAYYIDKESNTMVMTPETEAQMRAQAQAEMAASDSKSRGNATYNTAQQNGGGQGQYNSNDGSNGAGNNGGGENGAGAPAEEQVQERQPDADLPLIQQRLYNGYDRQLQEQAAYQQQLAEEIERNRQAALAVQRQRSQQAQQSLSEQLREMESRRQGTGGFSTKPYAPQPQSKPNNTGNTPQASSGDFVRSAYTTSTNTPTEPVNGESSSRPGMLPNNIIRAGTSWPVVIMTSVNTDEGLQVIAQVMDGPFVGSEVYGIVQQTGRDIGIQFTRIVPPNPRKPIIPVNAMALTIGSQKQAVSSDRNNHHLQNYSVMAAESAIQGYGDAYADQNETVILQSDGTVITSKGETTRKEVQGNILSQFAQRLNGDVAKLGNRAPTYYVRQGAVLQMKLLTNLDRNQVVSDIASSNQNTL